MCFSVLAAALQTFQVEDLVLEVTATELFGLIVEGNVGAFGHWFACQPVDVSCERSSAAQD